MSSGEAWLTLAEVADEIKSSQEYVRRELVRKNLRGTKLAGVGWRVSRADLLTYMDAKANVSAVRRRAS